MLLNTKAHFMPFARHKHAFLGGKYKEKRDECQIYLAFIALIKDLRDFKVLKVFNPAARFFPPLHLGKSPAQAGDLGGG